jgi:tRNA(Arg) A34 adenosine deaminase TadA
MRKEIMAEVLSLATENVLASQGGPFAAFITRGDEVLARGTNLVTSTNDPTAHAEIAAIRSACAALNAFDLHSCEPCPTCLGAIYRARLDRIYFAATREDAANAGFDNAEIYSQVAMPHHQRSIPIVNLMRMEGQEPMRVWKSLDRTKY